MSNPKAWQMNRACFALAFLIQALLCFPLAAGTSPTDRDGRERSWIKPLEVTAIIPSATSGILPPADRMERKQFREKLDEARTILEALRSFASTAQRAIQAGEKISTLRLENKRLKQGIADHRDSRRELERDLVDVEALKSSLTGTVVANWLASWELSHQDTADDRKLISARADWVETELRLASLRKQVTAYRKEAHSLRARRAALAAEIGRTRRRVINMQDRTRFLEENRKILETTTRQLRHDVSAWLQLILVAD